LIWLLLPGAVSFIYAKILAADLSGRGRPEFGSYTAFGGLVVTVVGNVLLVPRFGAVAAAGISSLAYLGEAIYLVNRYSKVVSVSYSSLLLPRLEDILGISDLIIVRSRRFLIGS
jgi:O-antigen/teichoic acid export membrane protein